MLSRTSLMDEAFGAVVDNYGKGLITIDDFAQLNEKSVEGLCQVLIKYFIHDEDMIYRGSIISGHVVLGTDPEEIGSLTNSFITNRTLIWDNIVAIFQVSDAWTYLKPAKNHRDGRLGFRLIYNHNLGISNIYHMAAGAEKNLAQ